MSGGNKPGNKATKRRNRAIANVIGRLDDLQYAALKKVSFVSSAGFLVERRLGWPADMVEPFSAAYVRLTDPFGIAVRDAIISEVRP